MYIHHIIICAVKRRNSSSQIVFNLNQWEHYYNIYAFNNNQDYRKLYNIRPLAGIAVKEQCTIINYYI